MKFVVAAALAAALLSAGASAAPYSRTGTFTQDNDKLRVGFRLAAPGTVTLTSLGYAGGVNAAGQTIAAGGFDTILSVYDNAGVLVADNDDGPNAAIDPVSGTASDAGLTISLQPGVYRAFLTQYSNFGPILLQNGFAFDDQPNFRGGFVDFNGFQRTGAYALDILGATTVPSAPALALFGLGAVALVRRRFA
jgi:hypothetical protein